MSDETMRRLLEVHRDEINKRDEEIASLKRDGVFHSNEITRLKRDLESTSRRLEYANRTANEHAAKVTKLEGVTTSLRIELQNEREAHTAARDAAHQEDDL